MENRYLSNLRFADDLVLLSSDQECLEKMGEEIIEASEEGGMEANVNKTKYMDNGKKKR